MGAIALIYSRDGAPVDETSLANMAQAMSPRGPDGADHLVRGLLGLAHQHWWTTPEEQGERQPLWDPESRLALAFDGRLDNRGDLLRDLKLDGPETRGISDAALILCAYQRWREACFGRLLGSFAFALYDVAEQRLYCARDPLGDCTLYYHVSGRRLMAASELVGLLGQEGVSDALDQSSLAAHFAGQVAEQGRTLYQQIRELPPAYYLAADAQDCALVRYWEPDLSRRIQLGSDREYAEHYRVLLDQAVRCRLRSSSSVGVMMSGGLDSTSVAALAAGQVGPNESLHTFTFVFDELEQCDEREYTRDVAARYQTTPHHTRGDDLWPLAQGDKGLWNPGQPEGNPYRELKQRVYQSAHQSGVGVLLTGGFSDHMYSGAEHWLADLVQEKHLAEAGRELLRYARHMGWRSTLQSATLRNAIRAAVPFDLGTSGRTRETALPAQWLTEFGMSRLPSSDQEQHIWDGARRHDQAQTVLGARAAHSASEETFYASRGGVQLWYPYRDLRLVEFMLAIPAYQLFNAGLYKYILRKAMWERLPGSIRQREAATSLLPLYVRGIYQRGSDTARDILGARGVLWPRYVRADWLWEMFSAGIRAPSLVADGVDQIALWNCISFELWRCGGAARSRSESREAIGPGSDG